MFFYNICIQSCESLFYTTMFISNRSNVKLACKHFLIPQSCMLLILLKITHFCEYNEVQEMHWHFFSINNLGPHLL
jgi:hypothetical protein